MLTKRLIFGAGILLALMPFLGFPGSWKSFFYIVIGLSMIAISFLIKDIRKPLKLRTQKKEPTPAFVENNPTSAPSSSLVSPHERVVRKIYPIKDIVSNTHSIKTQGDEPFSPEDFRIKGPVESTEHNNEAGGI